MTDEERRKWKQEYNRFYNLIRHGDPDTRLRLLREMFHRYRDRQA